MQKLRETRDSRYIDQNKLDKACFQHDMAYGDFEDLPWGTASDKVLPKKGFSIAKNTKGNGYQKSLASIAYKRLDKKDSDGDVKIENILYLELAREIHKPIMRKFEKREVHSSFLDDIWGISLVNMQLISEFNKGTCLYLQ